MRTETKTGGGMAWHISPKALLLAYCAVDQDSKPVDYKCWKTLRAPNFCPYTVYSRTVNLATIQFWTQLWPKVTENKHQSFAFSVLCC